jgi:hypothetical protein
LAVFYDVLKVFYVSYSGLNVLNFHFAALVFGVLTLRHLSSHNYRHTISTHNLMGLLQSRLQASNHVFYVPLSFNKVKAMLLDETLCVFAPVFAGLITGAVVMLLCPMRWYAGGVGVACILYLPPCLLSALYVRGFVAGRSHSDFAVRQIAAISMWVSLLVLSMFFQVMSGYICCWWIVCSCCASLSYHAALKHYPLFPTAGSSEEAHSPSKDHHYRNYGSSSSSFLTRCYAFLNYLTRPDNVYSIFMAPAITVWVTILRASTAMLLPLLGKTGSNVPPDLALGTLFGLLVGLSSGTTLANTVQKPMSREFVKRSSVLIGVILFAMMLFLSPYSEKRPKRMWMHHIHRVHLDHGPRSTFIAAVDTQNRPNSRLLADSAGAPSLMQPAHNIRGSGGPHPPHHHHRLRHGYNGTGLFGTATGAQNVKGPAVDAVAKPASVVEVASTFIKYENLPGAKVDHGLWIAGLDGLGLSPFKRTGIESLNGQHTKPCLTHNGDCYFTFPWFFPVALGVAGTHYIPTPAGPSIPERTRLNAEWSSQILTQQSAIRPAMRRIKIRIAGPDHMNIVIRDNAKGRRVQRWLLNGPTKSDSRPTSTAYRGDELRENQGNSEIPEASITSLMRAPTPPRADDGYIYLFQLEFGSCMYLSGDQAYHGACNRILYVDVLGEEPVDIAVYGHYMALSEEKSLTELRQQFPPWALGAEWTNFPSVIITGSI